MPRDRRIEGPADVLDLAAGSLRLCGAILLLWSMIAAGPALLRYRVLGGYRRQDDLIESLTELAAYALGGVAFLVVAHFIRRRHTWAGVVAFWLVMLALVLAALGTAAMIVVMLNEPPQWWLVVPITFGLLLVFALAQLTYHLSKTFAAMRAAGSETAGTGTRGFETIVGDERSAPFALPLPTTTANPPHPPAEDDADARSAPR